MFKTILVILCFFFCVFPLQCDDGDCDDKNNLQLPEETQIGDIISPIDEKIRKQFWYFLKNAKLIYQINMDSM